MSAAIRSITFEPLLGSSLLLSWMMRLPFFFILLGDQRLQRVDIVIFELGGVERAGLFLDQRAGEVEQIGVGLGIADVAEIGGGLVDLVGVAQRFEHHAAPARLEADDIFLPAHRELADADLLRLAQRLAQDDERFLGEVVGGGTK